MSNSEEQLKKAFEAIDKGNYATALEIFMPLAKHGDPQAQYNLGFLYRIGQGVKQDYHKAYHWYSLSAEQAYPQAQYKVGLMHYKGQAVTKDYQ